MLQSLLDIKITAAAATVLDDDTVAEMVNTLGGEDSVGSGGLVRSQNSVNLKTEGVGSPYSILTTDSSKVFTNEGASALVYLNLPPAVIGLTYTFAVQDVDGIRIAADTGDTIRIAGSVSAGAGYAESTTIGSCLTLKAINATEWLAFSSVGTWAVT